jgi:hypothetical protein
MIKLFAALGAMGMFLAGCAGAPVESQDNGNVAVHAEEVTASVVPAACRRVCETRCVRNRWGRSVCHKECFSRCY